MEQTSTIGCINSAAQVIGSKWTALILRQLADGPRRFCELESAVDGISPRTLSQRLDDLASEGVITREVYGEVPPRCEYSLTCKGEDLLPILQQMAAWSGKYAQPFSGAKSSETELIQ